ncbi:hypothetical protein TNCV_3340041 [Trichonephila clavipes]|nr:hypothetical protein TNCV_3340041 [Trichonephila clavipes]
MPSEYPEKQLQWTCPSGIQKQFSQSAVEQRNKWQFEKNNLSIGCLVLLKENDWPLCKWAMARILEVIYGTDGLKKRCLRRQSCQEDVDLTSFVSGVRVPKNDLALRDYMRLTSSLRTLTLGIEVPLDSIGVPLRMDFAEINSKGKRGELLGRIDRQNSRFRTAKTIIIKFALHASFVESESAKNALNEVLMIKIPFLLC